MFLNSVFYPTCSQKKDDNSYWHCKEVEMNCKVPIRTYGRKKCEERIIPMQKIHISTATINNSSIKKELSNNDSIFYDPFETTFDRLVKNTKTQTQSLKTYNATAKHNNTDSSSNSSSSISEEQVHYKCFLYNDIKLPDDDIKPVSKQKVQCNKSKMQTKTKIILRRDVSESQKNKKSEQVKKNKSYKKYKLRKARNNKKTTSSNTNIDSINLDSHMDISEKKDCHNKYNKGPNKKANNKYAFRKNNKNSNILNSSSNKSLKIVPCSVTLDKLNILEQKNNNDENNFTKGMHKNILKTDKSLKHTEITKTNIDNTEHDNKNVKHCFVKMEQLEISSDTKRWSSNKTCGNVISSTPIGRPVKILSHVIAVSPIPITYSEKLNESVTNIDSIPTSVNSKNNLVSLEFQQINEDSCGIKSGTSKKSLIKEKIELLPTCVTNTSKFRNYNLDQSEKIKMENTNSLAILNCTSNNTPKHGEHLSQVTCEKLLDSVKNILTTEIIKSITLDVSPELIQEHRMLDVVKKKHLNFSIDVNRSLSLFSDTNGSTQTSSCKPAINITKVTASDVILDDINKELSNKMYSDYIKLNKNSLLNVEDSKVETKFDDVKEDLYEMFIPAKLMISSASSGDVEFRVETEGTDLENKNTCPMKETESLLDKNHTLSSNKSHINNDDSRCNAMEPYVVLNRLEDPIRITKKRKRYRKWELDMDDISEDGSNSMQLKENQISLKRTSEIKKSKLSKRTLESTENIETYIHTIPVKIQKPIYLKPGKSWARSLSILNNIQNESNLDRLSVGKGKKWKDIVLDVLNMQNQGAIHSCMRKTRSDKELQVINETINTDEHELSNNKGRTSDSTSLGRLSRRISVRVVPINKTIKLIEDAPFLEVYGIVPINSQRITLSNPRKSSVCNIQNDDVDGEIGEEHTISTAKEVILTKCSQKDYISFSTYFSDSYLEYCRKIGEGVYGEVFLHEYEDKKTVIKIIPIEGDVHVNGEPQKKFHEILSEIIIAMELHNLRFNTKYNTDGFVNVKNIKCLKGEYPKKLVKLWNIYDEEKRSENDCPSMFNDDQLYIVLELGHGGQDLEAFVFPTAEEAYILFIQAALALAVAEKAIEFEHRDLHWGNVLISPTTESHIHYKLGEKEVKLISKGVKVSIIDFTLSRITYQECSIFNDLASDPSLFTAQGEYQFEIYRLMRDKIKNNWQTFEPYTNILWLHYTLDKMITAVRYRRRNLKIHKHGITKLKELKNTILTYSSAFDFVLNCDQVVSLLCNDSESDLASALREEMVIV
ncbi:uncharacterized protein LOC128890400 isoform X1 [Hylaeus anthracinus]|uniref:uncharacterized protein LOC128890400 isoform X1 n=2 Tax=Hylaeus anthracinus TaxID=313031 RepID=UPI0023BA1705|nr:uncharacterized protein LOC128890400 isoform X1 [Hylaeus anthracinus]XP_054004827.1 uncharacterized protein LOC128890400 isoform X1 [Hylaeus anthracinus]